MTALAPDRRVRMLRLAAADEGQARRGMFMVEDALRTASVPGGEGGRLLLVRRLALGRILPGQSATSVALAVEQALWRLGAVHVHGGHPAAPNAPAVYFRDRVDAAAMLAIRLAKGDDASAWFWPLAVPGWRPGMSAVEGLRASLAAALAALPAPAGAVALAEALLAEGCLSPLLAVLEPDDGPALLAACGWPRVDLSPAPDSTGRGVPPRWRPSVARWLATWGATDARSLWLATVVLASEQPGRQQDPTLAGEAVIALQTFAAVSAHPDVAAGPTPELVPSSHAPSASGPRAATSEPDTRVHEVARNLQSDGAGASGGSPPGARSERIPQPIPSPSPRADGGAGQPARSSGPQPGLARPWLVEAEFTRWAGLYLLLPVLVRLGMAEMLSAQPHLAAVALPQRVLRAVAHSLRIPAGDPALVPLRLLRPPRVPCSFVVPASWLTLATQDSLLLLSGVTDRPGVRVLTAENGLPVALWRDRAPAAVRSLVRVVERDDTHHLARGPALPPRSDLAILVRGWELALRGWLAQYTALTLRDVIARPGRIAATRTHLDVYFDHAQADVRLRRAGLDLDPGWLPWLGRVVTYHYEENVLWQAR